MFIVNQILFYLKEKNNFIYHFFYLPFFFKFIIDIEDNNQQTACTYAFMQNLNVQKSTKNGYSTQKDKISKA